MIDEPSPGSTRHPSSSGGAVDEAQSEHASGVLPGSASEASAAQERPSASSPESSDLRGTPAAGQAQRKPAGGIVSRFREWLWRGDTLAELRAGSARAPVRVRELHARARATFEIASRIDREVYPDPALAREVARAELLRQASYWALRTFADGNERVLPYETVWQLAPRDVLLQAAGTADELGLVREALVDRSFIDAAELGQDQKRERAARLARFTSQLLRLVEEPQRALDRALRQRIMRTGGLLTLLLGIVLGASMIIATVTAPPNLLVGKSYRLSSEWAKCEPEKRRCGTTNNTRIFFHTLENDNPWIEYDLKVETTFSRIFIKNRTDCCIERARPLVVEVSNDGTNWKEVARNSELMYRTWEAKFKPQKARFLRLRVARKSTLHLEEVKLFQ